MMYFAQKQLAKKALFTILLTGFGAVGFATNYFENFTFQGRLLEDGVPVNASREFDFYLVNESDAVIASQLNEVKSVVDGLFTVELSGFGNNLSFGDGLQYYIAVHLNDDPDPIGKIKITAAPYAVNALNALNAVDKTGDTMTGDLSISSGDLTLSTGELNIGTATLNNDYGSLKVDSGKFNVGADQFVVNTSGVGINNAAPSSIYTMDIRPKTGLCASVNLGSGGLLAGYSGDTDGVELDGGMYPNGTNHTARSTTASRVACSDGLISFHTDDNLTVGGTFSPTTRVVIDQQGDVGIGTTVPQEKLHVTCDDYSAILLEADTDAKAYIGVIDYGDTLNNAPGAIILSNVDYTGSSYDLLNESALGYGVLLETYETGSNTSGIKGSCWTADDTHTPLFHFSPDGKFHLFNGNYTGDIYVKNDGYLWVKATSDATEVRLTTHADPRSIAPSAQTSFDNQNVELPWSFQNINKVVGKGAIVDIAKGFEFLESLMQQQLGQDGGQLFFEYDLPAEQVISVDEHIAELVDQLISRKLEANPWTLVDLGASNHVPQDAVEQVEVTERQQVEETYTDYEINFDTNEIVEVEKTRLVEKEIGTGRFTKQLKSDYCLRDGKLYCRTSVDDLDLNAEEIPALPDWVLQRAAQPSQRSMQQTIDNQLSLGVQRVKLRELAQKSAPLTVKSEDKETAMAD